LRGDRPRHRWLVCGADPGRATANDVRRGAGGEAVIKEYVAVLSFAAREDQLFLRLSPTAAPGTGVPDGARNAVARPGTIDVIGGIGRYRGATGRLSHFLNPIALAFSALGGDSFLSAFSGSFDG
jgi:hypothetical protein